MNESSISITLYDMSGAPLNMSIIKKLEDLAEKIAKEERLVINVARG